MKTPTTKKDLEDMVLNKIQESVHLDYKDSRAIGFGNKSSEIAKDVSAFANADGGLLVYGVKEEHHFPIGLDGGVSNKELSRERLEQIIDSNIAPTIKGIVIIQIPIDDDNSAYVVEIPKSTRAPHQEKQSKKYYKRTNFKSEPMEDYEINDLRGRISQLPRLVNVSVVIERGAFIEFVVENIGEYAATDIQFEFSEVLTWVNGCPPQIDDGITVLSNGQKLGFIYSDVRRTFDKDSTVVKAFTVEISYNHPLSLDRFNETFPVDLTVYEGSTIEYSELYHQSKRIADSIDGLTKEVVKLGRSLEKLTGIARPTGIKLSITSLRQVFDALKIESEPKGFDPSGCSYEEFKEILNIPLNEAYALYQKFRSNPPYDLTDLDSKVSAQAIKRLKELFDFEEMKSE